MNSGINAALCSLKFTSVENISLALRSLGRGALIAKLDVKAAYRLIPVHPEDRPLLGIEWRGAQYVDAMLPFGLCSAPKIFTAVADGLEWILRQRGIRYIDHYLDYYVTFGPAGSPECAKALGLIQQTCRELGVPLAMEKLEGPATCLTFLGIEVDTMEGVLRLPQDKFKDAGSLGKVGVQEVLQEERIGVVGGDSPTRVPGSAARPVVPAQDD